MDKSSVLYIYYAHILNSGIYSKQRVPNWKAENLARASYND